MEQLGCLKVRRDTGEEVAILTKTRADNVCMCDSDKKLNEVLAEINAGLVEAGKKQTVSVELIDGVTNLVITESDGIQTKTPIVSSGGGGASSWNDLAYEEVEIIPETTLNFVATPEMGGMIMAMYETSTGFTDGLTYTVTFGGETYTCECMEGMVGNLGMLGGEDTGEPFAMSYEEGVMIIFSTTQGDVKVGVRGNVINPLSRDLVEPVFETLDLTEMGISTVNENANVTLMMEDIGVFERAIKRHGQILFRIPIEYTYTDVFKENASGDFDGVLDVLMPVSYCSTSGVYTMQTTLYDNLLMMRLGVNNDLTAIIRKISIE